MDYLDQDLHSAYHQTNASNLRRSMKCPILAEITLCVHGALQTNSHSAGKVTTAKWQVTPCSGVLISTIYLLN